MFCKHCTLCKTPRPISGELQCQFFPVSCNPASYGVIKDVFQIKLNVTKSKWLVLECKHANIDWPVQPVLTLHYSNCTCAIVLVPNPSGFVPARQRLASVRSGGPLRAGLSIPGQEGWNWWGEYSSSKLRGNQPCAHTRLPAGSHRGWYQTSPGRSESPSVRKWNRHTA